MNIKLKIAFLAALFFAPTSIYSEKTIRIMNREDCEALVEKFIKELEQESEATRPDGTPTILSGELKSLLRSLQNNESVKKAFIDNLYKTYSSSAVLNIDVEEGEGFEAFYLGCIIGFLDS